ncbi:YraN family protein [Clostridium polynesiense]|uniref:YraN family protein n=1 Tax=Clostridium polynesiense TaxID=1325933 RepID=UPI00058E3CAA|nr:YraN family protein [Clostridium polynesiense]
MNDLRKTIGSYGEELAVLYLVNNGYSIIKRNLRCSKGEIDIIAVNGEIVSFIEVKSRYNSAFGLPAESITCFKKNRIISSSKYFIHRLNLYNYYIRFDIIEVYFNHSNNEYTIRFLEDAFRLF